MLIDFGELNESLEKDFALFLAGLEVSCSVASAFAIPGINR